MPHKIRKNIKIIYNDGFEENGCVFLDCVICVESISLEGHYFSVRLDRIVRVVEISEDQTTIYVEEL